MAVVHYGTSTLLSERQHPCCWRLQSTACLVPQKASHSLKRFIMILLSRFLGKCITSCHSFTVLCSALVLCKIIKNYSAASTAPWCFAVTTVGQAVPCSGLLLTTVMVQMNPYVLSWTEEHWQL